MPRLFRRSGQLDKQKLDALYLASTTLPFADRQNAGVVAAALNLSDKLITADHSSSQKAATTALITAFESVKGGGDGQRPTGNQNRLFL
jgi:3-hydroxy-3-methylglutaryl CoA synthase